MPGPVVAYRHSVPPGPSAAAAPAIASPLAVVTNATSTGSSAWCVAPSASASRRRSARGSRTHTASTPRARAAATAEQPVRARADDEQRVARRRPARSNARSTQPSGSTNVPATGSSEPSASSSPTSGGRQPHLLGEPAGIERRRAKLVAERLVAAPAAPALAARHVVVDDDAVADRDRRRRPAPPTSTSPTTSWPSTHGSLRATYVSLTSEPQTPHASTRQTTSPGPATGSASSSMTTSRGVSDRATLMSCSVGLRRTAPPAARAPTRASAARRSRAR